VPRHATSLSTLGDSAPRAKLCTQAVQEVLGPREGVRVVPANQHTEAQQVWSSLEQESRQEVVAQFRRVVKEMIDEHFRIDSAPPLGPTAEIYVRQSSPNQVITNKESQRMQYALRERAITLGWHEQDIQVIDTDLGR